MLIKINIEGEAPKLVEVDHNASLVVGRSSQASLPIKSPSISRSHIKINVVDGKFYVTDLGSANGSYINQDKLPANEEVEWPDFFPLHLSNLVSLEIIKQKEPSQIIDNTTTFKTIELDRAAIKKRQPQVLIGQKKKRNKLNEEKSYSIHRLLFLAVIGIAVIYFYHNYQKNLIPSAETTVAQLNTKKEIMPQELLEISELKKLAKCGGDFGFLCKRLKIQNESNEGVFSDQKSLLVVLDFKERILNAEFDPSYSNTKDPDLRIKYLMLHLAFITLNEMIKGTSLQKLVIEDGSNGKLNSMVVINFADLFKFSILDLEIIFSSLAVNQSTLFNDHLLPLAREYSAP